MGHQNRFLFVLLGTMILCSFQAFAVVRLSNNCMNNADCEINSLTVDNLTVKGKYLNVSVVDYNVTGNITFVGDPNSGTISWQEDESKFNFNNPITITSGEITADNIITDAVTNHTIFVGDAAGDSNSGTYCNFLGESAGVSNTGASSNAFGYYALYGNTGGSSNAFGRTALYGNTGAYSNAFGNYALYGNTGGSSNAFGRTALYGNTGAYSNAFGHSALRGNTGVSSNAFGHSALRGNTGVSSNAFGYLAGRYNDGDDNIFIGDKNNKDFKTNAGGAKTFDNTDINVGDNQVTISGHSFGNVGDFVNIDFAEGTSTIPGLSAGVHQIEIIDANTVEINDDTITGQGTGTGHTFTPQYAYDNVIAIGHDIESTASDQTIIGSSDTAETLLRGNLIVGQGTAGTDYTLTFNGESNNGSLTWKDEDYFEVSDDVYVPSGERVSVGEAPDGDSWLKVHAPSNTGTGVDDGAIGIDNSANAYNGINAYTNMNAGALRSLARFRCDNALFDNDCFEILNDGSGAAIEVTNTNAASQAIHTKGQSPDITIGSGSAGIDPKIAFDGEDYDGEIRLNEDYGILEFDAVVARFNLANVYINDDGNNPRFLVGDSTAAGEWAEIQWNSASDTLELNCQGKTGLQLNEAGDTTIGGNLFVNRNMTVEDCITFDSGGQICSNTTCTFMVSPDGNQISEVCN